MRRKIGGAVVLGLVPGVMVLAMAASAQAKIVVGVGMAGIKLGESEAQVMTTLGAPTYKTPEGKVTSWGYPTTLEGRIGFTRGHVSGMWTISKHQKTSKGVGPGSSLAQVRKAYPAAKCVTGPFGPKSLICSLKSRYLGKAVESSFVFFTRSVGAREVDIDFG